MRKSIASISASLAFALALPGCGGPADPGTGLTLATEQSVYDMGDVIGVVLVNGTDERVRYEPCPTRWEMKTPEGYDAVVEAAMLCTSEILTIAAGETLRIPYSLPQGQMAGTYRIVLPVGADREISDTIRSAEFVVTE